MNHIHGVICGHIHKATVDTQAAIIYKICGDWVESCTALVNSHTGNISLLLWVRQSATLLEAAALREKTFGHDTKKAA